MFSEVVTKVVVALIGAGAVALAGWLLRGWGRRAFAATRSTIGERIRSALREHAARAQAARRKLETRGAVEAGENIVVSVTGSNPAKVREEGAAPGVLYYFRDLPTYKREVGSGRAPHLRSTCCGRPPKVGTRRKVSVPTRA